MFANDVTNALAEVFPSDPPRFLARTPHGYYDTALIRGELEEAAFSSVVIETKAAESRASSPRHPAIAYCQGTPLRNEIEARDAGKLEAATDYAASRIANRHGSGEVAAKIQAHVIVEERASRLRKEDREADLEIVKSYCLFFTFLVAIVGLGALCLYKGLLDNTSTPETQR